ncbi:L,D-transpeptidase [Legionella sp. W05-934-2]|jgi:hypothetical protein|uniref:L,D-transpeptidase n=1 Tax=Legionella sp. W05-934-2 TaxID=1198649 RepID=UPI003461DB0B
MIKAIKAGLLLCLTIQLTSCMEFDESTIVVDDNGRVHHTQHYLRDKRGRDYFPQTIKPMSQKLFIFDPRAHAWAAYDETGQRLMTGSASGGKAFCEDVGEKCLTAVGTFHVYLKGKHNCRSGEYPVDTRGGAKMPYCMFFYRGFTIHAAYEVPDQNTSHGCVRVLPSAAKWLNEEFMTVGTKVIVMDYPTEEMYPPEPEKNETVETANA